METGVSDLRLLEESPIAALWKIPGPLGILVATKPALFGRPNTEKKILVVVVTYLLKEAGSGLFLEGKVGR